MKPLVAFDRVRVRSGVAPLTFTMRAGDIVSTTGLVPGETASAILQVASARTPPVEGTVIINGLPAECWAPLELDRCLRVLKPVACRYVGCDPSETGTASSQPRAAHIANADAALLREALRRCGLSSLKDCEQASPSIRQRMQLAYFLVSLWTLPDGIRCVIVDGMLDALDVNLRNSGLEMLREFVAARAMAALVSCEIPGPGEPLARENDVVRRIEDPAGMPGTVR